MFIYLASMLLVYKNTAVSMGDGLPRMTSKLSQGKITLKRFLPPQRSLPPPNIHEKQLIGENSKKRNDKQKSFPTRH